MPRDATPGGRRVASKLAPTGGGHAYKSDDFRSISSAQGIKEPRGCSGAEYPEQAPAKTTTSLKGSAGYFGASDVQELCRQIEAAADAGDLSLVGAWIKAFEDAVAAAVERAENDKVEAKP